MTDSGVATAAWLDDRVEEWFGEIVAACQRLVAADHEPDWVALTTELGSALRAKYFGEDPIEQLGKHLEALSQNGWSAHAVANELVSAGAHGLATAYYEATAPEPDEAHAEEAWAGDAAEDASSAEQPSPANFPTLRLGDHGEWVEYLRTMLLHHGYDTGTQEPSFDEALEHLVHGFQRDHGLAPDGVVEQPTWAALLAEPQPRQPADHVEPAELVEPAEPAEPVEPVEPVDAAEAPGEEVSTTELAAAMPDDDLLAAEAQRLRDTDPALAELSEEEVAELLRERVSFHLQQLAATG